MFAIRAPLSSLGGALFSAALFLGLWQLVTVPMVAPLTHTVVVPEFTRQHPDTPVVPKPREKPQRPPPQTTVIEPRGPRGTSDPITPVRPQPAVPADAVADIDRPHGRV